MDFCIGLFLGAWIVAWVWVIVELA